MTSEEEAADAFGQAIRRAREAAGLSVRKAAERAGMSEGRWRQLERGYQQHAGGVRSPAKPRPATAKAMAQVVGLDQATAARLGGWTIPERVESVGGDGQDAEELVVLFRLPPGLSPRERERAQRLGEASVRAYLETLQDDDEGA